MQFCIDNYSTAEYTTFKINDTDPDYEIKLLYSKEQKLLIKYDADNKNKLVISSNSYEKLQEIEKDFKVKWLKKDGRKVIDINNYCNDKPLETYEERLEAIYKIYYSATMNLEVLKNKNQVDFPEELQLFYKIFNNKRNVLQSAFIIPKLKDIKVENDCIVFAEEEQGVSSYVINIKTKEVFYVSDEKEFIKENTSLAEFLIYILVVQGTGFMQEQGTISISDDVSHFFNIFKCGATNIYTNAKRKIIGFTYSEDEILLMSKSSSAFDKLEEDTDIMVSLL